MKIVGQVSTPEEAKEMEFAVKLAVVASLTALIKVNPPATLST